MSNRIDGYAQAMLAVARAEGDVEGIKAQLRQVSEAIDANDELRSTLSNNLLPAATRHQIVDDLLSGKATDTVKSLVAMVVGAGRGGELGEIVKAFGTAAAAAGGKQAAVVRTAVALTEDQKTRLAHALGASTGAPVELENIVDPDVVGGAVTTIGDVVIDGTLRTRISQMKEAI